MVITNGTVASNADGNLIVQSDRGEAHLAAAYAPADLKVGDAVRITVSAATEAVPAATAKEILNEILTPAMPRVETDASLPPAS